MRRIKLTREERAIENSIHEHVPVPRAQYNAIVKALKRQCKDIVLSIHIKQGDLDKIKRKAKKLGIKYQTFISEILHNVAMAK